ncbi:MAG: hypothetical protein M3N95_15005, partial [Actinomycetota bacterium]|nr:hypothetical protein [Actinomycetota bacterium]
MQIGEQWRFWRRPNPEGASYDSFYASFYGAKGRGHTSRHRRPRAAGVAVPAFLGVVVARLVPSRRTVLLCTAGVMAGGAILIGAVTVMAGGTGTDGPVPGSGSLSIGTAGANGVADGALPTLRATSSRAGAAPVRAVPVRAVNAGGSVVGGGNMGGSVAGAGVAGAGAAGGGASGAGDAGAGLTPSSVAGTGGVPPAGSAPTPGPLNPTPASAPAPTPAPPAPTPA